LQPRQAQKVGLDHLTNAIVFYQRAILLLKKSTNVNEQRWMIMPVQSGLGWCLEQSGRTNDAVAMYRKTLEVAWKVEIVGDFDPKQWVNEVWQDVRARRNPIHPRYKGSIGPGICFSQQMIDTLLRLLNPVKDAAEIAKLKADEKRLSTLALGIAFISCQSQVDANGMRWSPRGISFTNGSASTTYDWIVPGQISVVKK